MKLFLFLACFVMGAFSALLILAVVIACQKNPHQISGLSVVTVQELPSK